MNTADNNTALEAFLISIEKRAFVMAKIATSSEQDALDIVQDAMIKLVNKYSKKPSKEWPPLFYRILQSHIYDWQRKQKVRNRWRRWLGKGINGDKSDDENTKDSPLENHSHENDLALEQLIDNTAFGEQLEIAVTALPLRQKQAFMLRAWEQYSTAETASIMSCSQGSVKTHYSRALASLRKVLKEFSNDTD